MELIATDKNFMEIGIVKNASFDFEIGKYAIASNDFEMTVTSNDRLKGMDIGSLVYFNDTEYGGIIRYKKIDTNSSNIVFGGVTWRGLLEKEYIQPPSNATHYQAKGEANTVLKDMIGESFDDLIVVDEVGGSGITVNYQVCDLCLLDAIDRMLINSNARLEMKFHDEKLHLRCISVRDLSNELQYDNSYGLQMTVETPRKQYNHVIVLGKGVGTDRTRKNLYLQSDGSWKELASVFGLKRVTYKYSNSTTEESRDEQEEDVNDLIEKAIEKVTNENGSNTVNVSFNEDNAELFDVVSSKEEETGIFFKDRITQKIVKGSITDHEVKIEIAYKVGENK